ncbi:MAG: glycoside hydrolase [Proteobacteria bacterium]|nr:glycoside hydrolase [Pseudomonadota bacterium]
MTDPRLPVVLLWHMHQPPYRDALSGRYVLPWTYLHAIKDYTDMAAHLEEVPGAKAVVNFTPVLIEQIEDLTAAVRNCLVDGAPLPDALLATLGPAPLPLDPAARLALLRACQRGDRENLIRRHAPFEELVQLAQSFDSTERIVYASDQYLFDLCVWYHLAWMGEAVRREDERVVALAAKARGFDEADRLLLLGLIGELLAGVLPRFRKLAEQGRCELAVSPYSHPILPLLFDFAAARASEPHAPRPHHASYPGGAERVRWHLDRARQEFERVFGFAPRGCWPSEGAISDAAVKAIESAGFDWLATSVSVLRPSLHASGIDVPEDGTEAERLLNRGFAQPGSDLECYFRHDGVSDLVGFSYSRWHGDDAAANFAQELSGLAARTAGEPGRVLLVALDGENAWEYYPFNGWYFLRAMYAALASHPEIRLATLSEVVDEHRQAGIAPAPLKQVRAGSWVYGTLSTWMGDPDKNAGWDLLCDAKRAFDVAIASGRLEPAARARAEQQLAACEASDWFWWFGDYNPAGAVRDFDELFRHQLASLYRSLGAQPPAALEHRISIGRGAPESGGVMRRS